MQQIFYCKIKRDTLNEAGSRYHWRGCLLHAHIAPPLHECRIVGNSHLAVLRMNRQRTLNNGGGSSAAT